jgi:hypothetical protein
MGGGEEPGSNLAEARQNHLNQVNGVLRRPGMYGQDEMAERNRPASQRVAQLHAVDRNATGHGPGRDEVGLFCTGRVKIPKWDVRMSREAVATR